MPRIKEPSGKCPSPEQLPKGNNEEENVPKADTCDDSKCDSTTGLNTSDQKDIKQINTVSNPTSENVHLQTGDLLQASIWL